MINESSDSDARPSLITSASFWTKFSDYEIVDNEDGKQYIVSTKDAVMEQYYPFDYSSEILEKFLNITMVIPIKYRFSDDYLNYEKCGQEY